MAVPSTITKWREFAARDIPEPRPLTHAEYKRLSAADREAHDDARHAWINSDDVLQTRDVTRIDRMTQRLLHQNRVASRSARRNLVVSGPPALGKSTAALQVGLRVDDISRTRSGRTGDDFMPVIYHVVGTTTTPKSLMLGFAKTMGLLESPRAATHTVTDRVVNVMNSLGVRLVILDEVQNVRSNRVHGAEAAVTLRRFTEELDATFIYAGVNLRSAPFMTGPDGEMVEGRAEMVEMRRYSPNNEADRDEWQSLTAAFEQRLPLFRHEEGVITAMSLDLLHQCGGSIGSLKHAINSCASDAIIDGAERITATALRNQLAGDLLAERYATKPGPAPSVPAITALTS